MFKRALTLIAERKEGCNESGRGFTLRAPALWRSDVVSWARLIARARLYAACRASYFHKTTCEVVVGRLFDDLAETAHVISRACSPHDLRDWAASAPVRAHDDARALRNLLHIMDSLDVF